MGFWGRIRSFLGADFHSRLRESQEQRQGGGKTFSLDLIFLRTVELSEPGSSQCWEGSTGGGCWEKWNHDSVCRLQQKRPRLKKSSFSMGPLGSVRGQETFTRVPEEVGAAHWGQKGLGWPQMFCAQWSRDKKNISSFVCLRERVGNDVTAQLPQWWGHWWWGRPKSGHWKPFSATFSNFISYIAFIIAAVRYLSALLFM